MTTALPSHYTRVVLAERPTDFLNEKTFRTEIVPFDLEPQEGEILVKAAYLSLDPAQRNWIKDERSYLPPVQIGEVMRSAGLGVVVRAGQSTSRFRVGELVYGMLGWREYVIFKDNDPYLEKVKIPRGADAIDYLGPIGATGLTAYFGLVEVGKIRAGETLVVSGAAGATGSIVCQLGKKAGAKVIAISGSDDKCEWLEKELGVDKALNYKSQHFRQEFEDAVGHLDVFFDNVGGEILNLALLRLKKNARIIMCGTISNYNTETKGLTNYKSVITQRATMRGFLVFDYYAQYDAAREILGKWITDGSLKRKFHVVHGIEKCPEALPLLFSGGNKGKLVVKVADIPEHAVL